MLSTGAMIERERRLTETVVRERGRLRRFIGARVANPADVEDVLQDVFAELVQAEALMEPVRQVGAWLFRVARNHIIDRFRKQRSAPPRAEAPDAGGGVGAEPERLLEDWLPSPVAGPEAAYARAVLLEQLDAALEELPPEQLEVFVAHELEGLSFKELARQTGLGVNTLLSRKHTAVRHLRERLRDIYREFIET